MKELKIYKFQAKEIEDALRLVTNVLNSQSRNTSVDRSVMVAHEMIKNVLNEDIDKRVTRFGTHETDI